MGMYLTSAFPFFCVCGCEQFLSRERETDCWGGMGSHLCLALVMKSPPTINAHKRKSCLLLFSILCFCIIYNSLIVLIWGKVGIKKNRSHVMFFCVIVFLTGQTLHLFNITMPLSSEFYLHLNWYLREITQGKAQQWIKLYKFFAWSYLFLYHFFLLCWIRTSA